MKKIGLRPKNLLFKLSNLEKKHKVITYASLLFLTVSTYFLRTENQTIKIDFAALQERSNNLKQNMIIFNRNYEGFPMPVWQKVKKKDKFIIQYVNPSYLEFFGYDFDYSQYNLMGKSNFDLFPKQIAQQYYENDVAVSVTGKKLETTEYFTDKSGKKLELKVIKWRDVKDNKDTLVYGMVKEILPMK